MENNDHLIGTVYEKGEELLQEVQGETKVSHLLRETFARTLLPLLRVGAWLIVENKLSKTHCILISPIQNKEPTLFCLQNMACKVIFGGVLVFV